MNSPLKNPLQPASIVEGSKEENDELDQIAFKERVERNGTRKNHTLQVIEQIALIPLASQLVPITRIKQCSDYLAFNKYTRLNVIKLASANFCKVHQICSQCAQRRATKLSHAVLESVIVSKPTHLQLITLTVLNDHNLDTAMQRLFTAFKILLNRYKCKNKKGSIANSFLGGIWSIEITWSEKNGWHPHIHGLISSSKTIYTNEVRAEWKEITNGESFICDSTKVDISDHEKLFKSVKEVCKYTLKNSSLPAEKLMDFYLAVKKKTVSTQIWHV